MERREFEDEGIDGTRIDFVDNQPTVALCIDKRSGLLALLDEECRLPRSTDKTYLDRLREHVGGNPAYVAARSQNDLTFTIKHFAGEVRRERKGGEERGREREGREERGGGERDCVCLRERKKEMERYGERNTLRERETQRRICERKT